MQDGVLWADNTDGAGFMQDITRFVSLQGASLLFLGAGGAVRGLLPSLLEQGIVPAVASRKETTLLALQEAFPAILPFLWQEIPCSFDIVVHATSAMVKKEELQVPAILWKDKTFYYDLSYSKKEDTPFVSMAKAQGYFAQDGFGMLVLQAVESFYCWHGVKPNFRSFIGSKVLS
jgi:shikimate dehydrogenase